MRFWTEATSAERLFQIVADQGAQFAGVDEVVEASSPASSWVDLVIEPQLADELEGVLQGERVGLVSMPASLAAFSRDVVDAQPTPATAPPTGQVDDRRHRTAS